jgi:hypothetical protein
VIDDAVARGRQYDDYLIAQNFEPKLLTQSGHAVELHNKAPVEDRPGLAFAVGERWFAGKTEGYAPYPLYPSLSGCCVTA